MSDRDFSSDSNHNKGGGSADVSGSADEPFDQISRAAREAGTKAKKAASEAASAIGDHFKEILDQQIGRNIDAAGVFAGSMKNAASDLDAHSPVAASIVRDLAGRLERFAEDFEGETVEQLARSASDLTRRQPAVVFGIAALAGFLAFRAITIGRADTSSPSIQPAEPGPVA
jgi:hypothetical protein